MEAPLLEMKHLDISYDGEAIVKDFQMQVFPAEIIGIAGESGCGKSTVIRAAMGLLETEGIADRGDVYFQGRPILDLPLEEKRKLRGSQMAMIFQNAGASMCPIRTIGRQFDEMLTQHGRRDKKKNREEILSLLKSLHFPDGNRILKSYPFELSGGMNQRVGIALAMILQPRILFADEPTSALDVTVQAEVAGELLKIRERYGTSIVIVSHNIALLEHLSDKLIIMKDGEIIESGATKEVIKNPRKEYTRSMLAAVPRLVRRGSA